MNKPRIAIIGSNILSSIGLKSLLEKVIPFAEISIFADLNNTEEDGSGRFFHYFVTPDVVENHLNFFMEHRKKTIILTDGQPSGICSSFHCILTNVSQASLLKQLLILQQMVHSNYARFPKQVAEALNDKDRQESIKLTKREIEILQDIARGKSSKEIAEKRHISLSTVLTHRKNLMAKTNAHSAARLVVYAVHHGYIQPEEIN